MLSPEGYYLQQKEQYNTFLSKAAKDINRIAMLRLLMILCGITIAIWAFRNGESGRWYLVGGCLALFLVLVRIHNRLSDKRHILQLHLSILDNELMALQGNYTAFADGAAYVDVAHPYSYDLDIFGKGSIFQALCRTVTAGGNKLLAQRLSSLVFVKETIIENQGIIKELQGLPDYLQAFRVAGIAIKEGTKDQERLTAWLNGPELFLNNKPVRIAAVVMPVLSLVFITWSVIISGVSPYLFPVLIINWFLLGSFQKKIKAAVQQTGNCAPLVDKYESLLKQVAGQPFTGQWLRQTAAEAGSSLGYITQFKKLVHLFDSRGNGMTGPLMNTFFLFDFYCLLRLEAWRKKHRATLIKAIDDMIAMDVWVSCAVYTFNRPGHIYPGITHAGNEIVAVGLRHPLLADRSAVGNDFSIGHNEQFYLLTGANMTGKSTFIRTIGVCNVMSNLGLPLPATELSLPLLDLYTSMRITDSVQDDISYFRAELNRIKNIIDQVKGSGQPCLVLLDEPLRGTNSTDKQQGTRSIVETLLTCHAIGIVATHDTGLCDMAINYPGRVSNFHFESKVEASGLSFDFRLKQGCSTSNNATALMRQMGIIK
jgi:hypothetical protein